MLLGKGEKGRGLEYRAGHCRQEYPVAGGKEKGPILSGATMTSDRESM